LKGANLSKLFNTVIIEIFLIVLVLSSQIKAMRLYVIQLQIKSRNTGSVLQGSL